MNQEKENSFSYREQLKFYKKKWIKDNLSGIILYVLLWIAFIVSLKQQNIEGYVIAIISVLSAIIIGIVEYYQMMIYVKDKTNK